MLIAILFLTFIDLWQERPVTSLLPVNDGIYRYAGAIHVHSTYSDGGGTIENIVKAAQETDLDFVVLTEHSTMQPLLDGVQRYYGKVLVLVGEEVNTSAGHLTTLGVGRHMEQDGPQGLQALLDTIHAAGGLAIPAHPNGRRPWKDWSLNHINGLEILNADSEWRNDYPWELLRALIWYAFLPQAALNSLADRPDAMLDRWQNLSQKNHVIGIGSVDAHARIPLWGDQILQFPSYERMFHFLRTYAVMDYPLTGVDSTDCMMIQNALHKGRSYMAFDGYEPAQGFSFYLTYKDGAAQMGDHITLEPGSVIHVETGSSNPILIRIFRDNILVLEKADKSAVYSITNPGIYRTEVYQLRRRLPLFRQIPRPWIFSNPIWVK